MICLREDARIEIKDNNKRIPDRLYNNINQFIVASNLSQQFDRTYKIICKRNSNTIFRYIKHFVEFWVFCYISEIFEWNAPGGSSYIVTILHQHRTIWYLYMSSVKQTNQNLQSNASSQLSNEKHQNRIYTKLMKFLYFMCTY